MYKNNQNCKLVKVRFHNIFLLRSLSQNFNLKLPKSFIFLYKNWKK